MLKDTQRRSHARRSRRSIPVPLLGHARIGSLPRRRASVVGSLPQPARFLLTLLAVALIGTLGSVGLLTMAVLLLVLANARTLGVRQASMAGIGCLLLIFAVHAGASITLKFGIMAALSVQGMVLFCVWLITLRYFQKPREETLLEGDDWRLKILERAREGFWVIDDEWHVILVNQRIVDVLGFARTELEGEDFRSLIVPSPLFGEVRDFLANGERADPLISQVFTFRCHNGSTRRLSACLSALRARNGRFLGLLVQTDDTLEQEPRFSCPSPVQRVVRTPNIDTSELIGFMIVDDEGIVVHANPLFLKTIGYTPEELAEGLVTWSRLTPPDFFPADPLASDCRAAPDLVGPRERQLIRKDGSRVAVLLDITPREPSTRTWSALSLDVTARNRIEQEWKAAKDAAESENKAKDEFLACLGHELRTPLTPILLMATAMLSDPETPDELRAFVELARRNVVLETHLIDELLDITRIARGKLQLKREIIDVHEVIRDALEICRNDFQTAGMELSLELLAEHPHLDGDAGRLQQVFWNLFKNAVKFSPRHSMVRIRTRNEPRGSLGLLNPLLVIEVEDCGIGIEPHFLPRMFNAFEQGEPGLRHSAAGLGLGLAISRSIVTAHGGSLEAASAGTNQGTTFSLRFPTSTPLSIPSRRNGNTTPLLNCARRPLKILLAEDNAETCAFLRRMLTEQRHVVVAVDSVESAYRSAEGRTFDLLISDIQLPDGSGLELMRALGGRGIASGIALSGFGSDEDVRLSKEAGFADHLTKPIDFRQLVQSIETVTSFFQGSASDPPVWSGDAPPICQRPAAEIR